jgi:hypothetical protein
MGRLHVQVFVRASYVRADQSCHIIRQALEIKPQELSLTRLSHLGVGAGVRDDEKAGLLEGLLDLVSEGTGSVAAGHVVGASVLAELEHSALSVGASRDHANCTSQTKSRQPSTSLYTIRTTARKASSSAERGRHVLSLHAALNFVLSYGLRAQGQNKLVVLKHITLAQKHSFK